MNNMKLVVFDADDVNIALNKTIVNDDLESYVDTSEHINKSSSVITEWAEDVGGQVITNQGDSGIVMVPDYAIEELPMVKEEYSNYIDASLTIGVGDTLAEAKQATIVGKLNGKNQINIYDNVMEEYIDKSEYTETDLKKNDSYEEGYEAGYREGAQHEHLEHDEAEEGEDEYERGYREGYQEGSYHEEVNHGVERGADDENEEYEDAFKEGVEHAPKAHGSEMDPDALEDGGEFAEEDGSEEFEEDAGEEFPEASGEAEGEVGAEDGLPEDEEGEAEEESIGEQYIDDEEGGEEDEADFDSPSDTLGDELQDTDEEQLREDIVTALEIFMHQKDILESMEQENPELYAATVVMLHSMIDMAKLLGMDDAAGFEEAAEYDEENYDPSMEEEYADEEEAEGDVEEDMDSGAEDDGDDQGFQQEDGEESEDEEEDEDEDDDEDDKPFEKSEEEMSIEDYERATGLKATDRSKKYFKAQWKFRADKREGEKIAKKPKKVIREDDHKIHDSKAKLAPSRKDMKKNESMNKARVDEGKSRSAKVAARMKRNRRSTPEYDSKIKRDHPSAEFKTVGKPKHNDPLRSPAHDAVNRSLDKSGK